MQHKAGIHLLRKQARRLFRYLRVGNVTRTPTYNYLLDLTTSVSWFSREINISDILLCRHYYDNYNTTIQVSIAIKI
jgi:hypothetical protein